MARLACGCHSHLVVDLVVIFVDLEHVRSLRPPFLVSAYLIDTLLLDLTRVLVVIKCLRWEIAAIALPRSAWWGSVLRSQF